MAVSEKGDESGERASGTMPRRSVLAAASGVVLAAVATGGRGLGVSPAAAAPQPANAPNASLVATALDCAGTGEICLQHCLREFTAGQTMLAQCAKRVAEMIPACEALASLAALESQHLAAYAKVCADICQSCEDECRKHESHHAICKECADTCVKLVEACRKVAA